MKLTKEELETLKQALECYCSETDLTEDDKKLMEKLDNMINKGDE